MEPFAGVAPDGTPLEVLTEAPGAGLAVGGEVASAAAQTALHASPLSGCITTA